MSLQSEPARTISLAQSEEIESIIEDIKNDSLDREFLANRKKIQLMAEMILVHKASLAPSDADECVELAIEWVWNGFSISEASEWIEVGIMEPSVAGDLMQAAIVPEDVKKLRLEEINGEEDDDIGIALSIGTVSVDDIIRSIKHI